MWDAEATTFVFPWGHLIPSLEDASLGLHEVGKSEDEYLEWLVRVSRRELASEPGAEANMDLRRFLVLFLGRLLFATRDDIVHCRFLPLLEDLSEVGGYAWGVAFLAHQFDSLGASERQTSMSGFFPFLQASLGLHEVGKSARESEDEYLERLVRVSRRELASEPGAEADMDLRRFLVLFLGILLFATRGDIVHCRFLPLMEDLSEVGGYAWGVAFLAHQFDSLGASERQTSMSGFFPFLQVWAYLHLPAVGRGDLTRSGLVPIARRWDSRRDSRNLGDQLERLQEAIDSYPYLDLAEGDEGQPWLLQARSYFGRLVWLHALNLVLPLHLYLIQRSLGLRQNAVEFFVRDRFRRPGRSFRGLHDTTDWRERAKEQIDNWEGRGKAVRSDATTDDAYLQAYALKYGSKVYKSARHQAAQRLTAELVKGARGGEENRSRRCFLFSRCRGLSITSGGPETDLRLTTEHTMDMQGQRDQLQGKRYQLQGEI
ncbi:hypothetical protein Taro_028800 [Colocasia esculenta]|uniref:Aminotransferase-like plant mobile domain-containing protein n=1 Tax=Colocasia esculenta TaxID=4460 RepID=A0A843VM48_COLES|nr:hypothetical protein [Colocasia esculenta]